MTQVILQDYDAMHSFCETGNYDGYYYELLRRDDGYFRLTRREIIYELTDDVYPRQDTKLGEMEVCDEGFGICGTINQTIEEYLYREIIE